LLFHNISNFMTSTSRFSHVFWIDASSEDTIALGLNGLCSHPEAKAAGVSVSSESALIWIGSLQSEWLLVFDNADGAPEVVEKFFPSGSQGNILVTSRNRSLGRVTSYENSLEVDQMAEKEAISLLVKASHLAELPENVYIAQQIVNGLCCLPLAVDQAGACIEAGLCSIDNYLEHLSRHRKKLMNHPSFRGASQYNHTVYETWDLSFNEIESRAKKKSDRLGRAAAQAAILILETAAFLHHENIIEAVFRKAAMQFSKRQHSRLESKVKSCINQFLQLAEDQFWNELFFHEGIRVLMSFSLIKQCSTSPRIYAIHPLMHQWSRDRMSVSQKRCMMQVSKLILVNSITKEVTTENIAFNRLLVPHIKANYQSQEENGFKRVFDDDEYSWFSYVLRENGMWKDVEYLEFQIVEIRMKKQGIEHPSTLTSMGNIAVAYLEQGKYKEAENLQLKVLELCKKVLGPEHPSTLTSIANLAITYSKQGKYEEAENLGLKVLDLRKRVLGPEHPDTLTSISHLTHTSSIQGKYKAAGETVLKILDVHKRVLGSEHPDTLRSMGNLAYSFSKQGKYEVAGELQLKVLDLCIRVLGPEHPDTLDSMANLAFIYSKQGKYDEAAALQLKVLDLYKNVLGPEHPDTLAGMANLACIYLKQGKYEKAVELQLKVLDLHKKVLQPEHPDTLISMGALAYSYSKQGKYEEARQLQLKVLDIHNKVLGSEHPDTLTAMNNLAVTYLDQGKYEEAGELQLKALDLHKRVLGPEHPYTLTIMNNLSGTYSNQGKYEEAIQLQLKVCNLHTKILGLEHPSTLDGMVDLAFKYSKGQKYDEAAELHLKVLHQYKKVLGLKHPKTLSIMSNLAIIYAKQGKNKEAEELQIEMSNSGNPTNFAS
jgi:tetratricopeptide (TPR) repeat protein